MPDGTYSIGVRGSQRRSAAASSALSAITRSQRRSARSSYSHRLSAPSQRRPRRARPRCMRARRAWVRKASSTAVQTTNAPAARASGAYWAMLVNSSCTMSGG
jgi:hypothetical protein